MLNRYCKKSFSRYCVLVMVIFIFSGFLVPSIHASDEKTVKVNIDRRTPDGVSAMDLGVTLTHVAIDSPKAIPENFEKAKSLITSVSTYVNVHIMGWGTGNPSPNPGQYDWSTLDNKINLIRSMGATPVITLCCSPDWMKTPGDWKYGTPTDYSKLTQAPLSEHYGDFAELARQVALRYPDVKYFQVWNEMKGFWNSDLNNNDYFKYTDLYNHVYDALKSVNKDIKVGGPYLIIQGTGSDKLGYSGGFSTKGPIQSQDNTVLDYWLEHKHGADFITIDKALTDYHDPYKTSYLPSEAMALTYTFESVANQIRQKTDLPIWWAESYGYNPQPKNYYSISAAYGSIMYHMLKGGSSVNLVWNPMEGEVVHSFITDTSQTYGGQPLPNYYPLKAFHDYFKKGTQLYKVSVSSPDINVLASRGETLLINTRKEAMPVQVDQLKITLEPFEVRVINASSGDTLLTNMHPLPYPEPKNMNSLPDFPEKQILFKDDFNDETIGQFPSGYIQAGGGGTITVSKDSPDNKALYIEDHATNNTIAADRYFANSSGRSGQIVFEYKYKQPDNLSGFGMELRKDNTIATEVQAISGKLTSRTGSGADLVIMPLDLNRWYKIKMIADTEKQTFDVYVDDNLVSKGLAFLSSVTSVNKIRIHSGYSQTGTMFIDDVSVSVPVPGSIAMSPNTLSLQLGESTSIHISLADPNDNSVDVTEASSFSTSNPQVATVDSSGLVIGVSPGTAVISAEYGGKQIKGTVVVKSPILDHLKLDSDFYFDMLSDEPHKTVVTAVYSDGKNMDVTKATYYVSAKPDIAFVNPNGVVTAVQIGETSITAAYGGKTATATVVVPELKSIRLDAGPYFLSTGEKHRSEVIGTFTHGFSIYVKGGITYTSLNPQVAEVDSDGVVKGISPGSAVIFAEYDGKTDQVQITVF